MGVESASLNVCVGVCVCDEIREAESCLKDAEIPAHLQRMSKSGLDRRQETAVTVSLPVFHHVSPRFISHRPFSCPVQQFSLVQVKKKLIAYSP